MIIALWVAVIALWVLFFATALALLALYRHFGQMYMGLPEQKIAQGPELDSALPSLALTDTRGREVLLPAPQPTAIVFASTTCTFCTEIREVLSAPPAIAEGVELVVFCSGPRADVTAWASRTADSVHVIWDSKERLIEKFEVNGTPYAIAVGPESRVRAKGIINGLDGIEWAATQARAVAPVSIPAGVEEIRIEERVAR
ncbi:hypothetical protein [Glaciihabitans sp. UYNi722]|uniref:hypothetical protein n=1 Tax=Glaciihabitans sp. UYNi722 TaxID=3156344 RepID=UPI0033942DAA